MDFIPHTKEDIQCMLNSLGLPGIDNLFDEVQAVLPPSEVPTLPGSNELELRRNLAEIARLNGRPDQTPCFRGAGAYEHFIPAAVSHILSKGEFLTAYTPYQAELSQGTCKPNNSLYRK